MLQINGVSVTREATTEPTLYYPPDGEPAMVYLETFPDGRPHFIHEFGDTGRGNNTQDYKVPLGHYFMLGDNRDNSADSRHPRVGFVPLENLRGRVLYVYWAQDWSRIGTVVE